MSINDTSRNGSVPTTIEESTEPVLSHEPTQARESTVLNGRLRWSRLFGQFSVIFKWTVCFRFRLPEVLAGG